MSQEEEREGGQWGRGGRSVVLLVRVLCLCVWLAGRPIQSRDQWQRDGRRRDGFPAGGGGDGDTRAFTGGSGAGEG